MQTHWFYTVWPFIGVGGAIVMIVILLMTAYADQRERASNLDALIHDVILKPFTLAEIKSAVNDALAAHKQRAG